MCSRQCYSCLFIQYTAVSYFTAEMHSQDLMELTPVYSFEQSRGDSF